MKNSKVNFSSDVLMLNNEEAARLGERGRIGRQDVRTIRNFSDTIEM
jgi:hypothetical protein